MLHGIVLNIIAFFAVCLVFRFFHSGGVHAFMPLWFVSVWLGCSCSPLLGEALMPMLALAGKPVCSVFEFFFIASRCILAVIPFGGCLMMFDELLGLLAILER